MRPASPRRQPLSAIPLAALINLNGLLGPINTDAGQGVQALFDRILRLMLVFAYPLAFVSLVYSAYLLITSAGKPEAYGAARKNINYLLVGSLIIIFAVYIVRFFITLFGSAPAPS
jgi:hypothetical protein